MQKGLDLVLVSGCLGSSVFILVGTCPACGSEEFGGVALPAGGAAMSLALRLSASESSQRWGDGLVAISVLLGFVLIAFGAVVGEYPCNACLLFWCCMAGLLISMTARGGQISRYSPVVVAVGLLVVVAAFKSDDLRLGVRSALPGLHFVRRGLPIGARFPYIVHTEAVAVATECSVCSQTSFRQAVRRLKSRGVAVTIYVPEARLDLAVPFADCPRFGASSHVYRALRMSASGTPTLYFLSKGVIVASKTPREVR